MPTPAWSAARSGLLGDTGAMDASAQVNQFLGTHGITAVYQGNPILTPVGSGGTAWQYHLDAYDIAQPFTMSGTAIGRVAVPLLPVGSGTDLIVSLYTNSAGAPGTLVNSARIPAAWISRLAAVSGVSEPSSISPITQYTNSPLAVSQFNTFHMGATTLTNWSYPVVIPGFSVANAGQTYYGNYYILIGGQGGAGGTTFVNNVFTIAYDTAGNLSQAIPQPAFPTNNSGSCATAVVTDPSSGSLTVVAAGGSTASGVHTAATYTASFDPVKGVVSAWTSQANLPQVVWDGIGATWNGYFYSIGGTNGGNTADLNTVYYAQVQNGQITAWNTANPIPAMLDSTYATAINGFLVVFGGETFGLVNQTTCWYAPINANGSLGAWQTGPPLPTAVVDFQFGTPLFSPYGVMAVGNGQAYLLGFGANGPDTAWQVFTQPQGGTLLADAASGPGTWVHYGLYGSYYSTFQLALTPRISVPLPTTGLTNSATYHIVLSQPGGDSNDYLRTHDDVSVFPGNPTMLTRAKSSSTWTAGTTGHAVPITIYDQTVIGKPWHLWEDSGARISTLVWGTTPNQPLLGLLEATSQPGPILNQWPTFVQGIGPWHPTGGTFVQSSAQTHGNLPFSGLLTPNGVASQAYAEGDLVPVQQGHSYVLTAWLYSPTGYSNVAVSANWFNSSGTYISTTSGSATSVPAATWTQLQTTVTNNVTNAVSLDMVVLEGGTPPGSALLYVSAATVQDTSGPQVSSVLSCKYAATWPSAGMWPPLGVTELA